MTHTVLYLDDSALMLQDIKRDKEGRIRRAWVVNGAWTLTITGNQAQARDGYDSVVTRRDFERYAEIAVELRSNNYNTVIWAADKQRSPR
jgi:hypothetical protein